MTDLTRQFDVFDAATYTWTAPYSLNVTHAEPDIIYCVNVTSTICSQSATPSKATSDCVCNVTESKYTIPTAHELYQIEVSPRTNLKEVSCNGTSTNAETHQGLCQN